jgi:hypothetical protein
MMAGLFFKTLSANTHFHNPAFVDYVDFSVVKLCLSTNFIAVQWSQCKATLADPRHLEPTLAEQRGGNPHSSPASKRRYCLQRFGVTIRKFWILQWGYDFLLKRAANTRALASIWWMGGRCQAGSSAIGSQCTHIGTGGQRTVRPAK